MRTEPAHHDSNSDGGDLADPEAAKEKARDALQEHGSSLYTVQTGFMHSLNMYQPPGAAAWEF